MNMNRPVALLGSALLLTACHAKAPLEPETKSLSPQADLIEAYVAAFNAKDAQAMSEMMHPDIEWLAIDGSQMETVMSGKDALTMDIERMFNSDFRIRASTSAIHQTGPHLVTVETARYPDGEGGEASQSAISVYEIGEDNLIRRVWYFPETVND